jgi:hypothetical protein
MSRLREFFSKLPEACGVENAEAYGKMNELAFDYEVANKDSQFSRKAGVSASARLLPAFGFRVDPDHDQDAADYAFQLATLAEMAYSLTKGIGDKQEVDMLAEELDTVEADFPAISALLTVQEASTMGQWA